MSKEHLAEEGVLFADNDHRVYDRKWPFVDNLDKKRKRGVYDYELSKKLWQYYADEISKAYLKEQGREACRESGCDGTGSHAFSVPVRKLIGLHYANLYEAGDESMKKG